jgi:DNA-binding response OmpR family regulator
VTNAEMALLLHYDNTYDLILCDLRLPTMSSFLMASTIRMCERKYGLRNTKIIFMTSIDHRDIKTAVLAMGVDALLIKPLQAQCVMSLIEFCQTQVVNA